jgi:hypothetical protein
MAIGRDLGVQVETAIGKLDAQSAALSQRVDGLRSQVMAIGRDLGVQVETAIGKMDAQSTEASQRVDGVKSQLVAIGRDLGTQVETPIGELAAQIGEIGSRLDRLEANIGTSSNRLVTPLIDVATRPTLQEDLKTLLERITAVEQKIGAAADQSGLGSKLDTLGSSLDMLGQTMRRSFALIVPPPDYTPVNLPLLLISQVQRSGGTLLSQLFDAHPQILAFPSELHGAKRGWPNLTGALPDLARFLTRHDRMFGKFARGGYSKFAQVDEGDRFPFEFDFRLRDRIIDVVLTEQPNPSSRDVLIAFFTAFY